MPYDKPLPAHDMLLRFLSIDLLGAAGPAAQVPSRVGDELEAVLGETHVNGTAVVAPSPPSGNELGVEGLGGNVRLPLGEGAQEALVNAGSAVVVILLMLAAFGLFVCYRRRQRGSLRVSKGAAHARAARRDRSSSGGRDDEGENELDELVGRADGGYSDGAGKGKGRVERESEIFGLGDDEEDDVGRKR